jgi:hypothetical protein
MPSVGGGSGGVAVERRRQLRRAGGQAGGRAGGEGAPTSAAALLHDPVRVRYADSMVFIMAT